MKKKRKLNNPVKRIYLRFNLTIKETDFGLKPLYDKLDQIQNNNPPEEVASEMSKVVYFVLHEYCRSLSSTPIASINTTETGQDSAQLSKISSSKFAQKKTNTAQSKNDEADISDEDLNDINDRTNLFLKNTNLKVL